MKQSGKAIPQGPVTDPQQFVISMEDIVKTIDRFAVNHRLFADDNQLLTHV